MGGRKAVCLLDFESEWCLNHEAHVLLRPITDEEQDKVYQYLATYGRCRQVPADQRSEISHTFGATPWKPYPLKERWCRTTDLISAGPVLLGGQDELPEYLYKAGCIDAVPDDAWQPAETMPEEATRRWVSFKRDTIKRLVNLENHEIYDLVPLEWRQEPGQVIPIIGGIQIRSKLRKPLDVLHRYLDTLRDELAQSGQQSFGKVELTDWWRVVRYSEALPPEAENDGI